MAEGGSSHFEKIFSGYGDQRYPVDSTKYPYCCVASLQFIFQKTGSSKYSVCNGTGFLAKVKESYQIITAAHLTTHDENIPLSKIQISLGRDGEVYPYGMIIKQADNLWVHPKYNGKLKRSRKYDLASILIEEDENLTSNGFNKEKYFHLKSFDRNQSLQMSGYSGSVENQDEWEKNTQWEVKLTDLVEDGAFTRYKNATTSGNSGSAIYASVNDNCYVMALHITGSEECNTGLIFTRKKLKILEGIWEKDSELDSDSDMYLY